MVHSGELPSNDCAKSLGERRVTDKSVAERTKIPPEVCNLEPRLRAQA